MPARNPPLAKKAADALAEVGDKLRAHRRGLKINATSAAEAAGLSRVTLHRIEKGEPSVTAGAYAAAAEALGLHVQLATANEPASSSNHEGWIPARVRLAEYPVLRELAWQVHGTDALTPREALDIYERNWRHVDTARLSAQEKHLVDALREALAPKNAV